jgi:NAD+ synthase (glutamine-hydrolysing)
MTQLFDSLYKHGFVRTAVCVPFVRVGDPGYNTARTIALARQASDAGAILALFPELGISAYSNDDLFQQDALLEAVQDGIARIVEESRSLRPMLVVGAPIRVDGRLYNCALIIASGTIRGIVPKSYLPNYREFYEARQFASGRHINRDSIQFLGEAVPFGTDLLFEAENVPGFTLFVEICEDLWAPVPPSTWGALAGATVIANLSASNITVGKADYRHRLCASQSGRCISAYLYSGSGPGESTTDLAWDGHALIYENSDLLAESVRFSPEEQLITGDVDLERLLQDRSRLTTFTDAAAAFNRKLRRLRRVRFALEVPSERVSLKA